MPDKQILGVDAGGTFTDFVLFSESGDGYQLHVHKVLSTPAAPELAILQGIKELKLDEAVTDGKLLVIHGSTVATNATLEGKGATTAFITNKGFADMLTLGRQTRPILYSLEQPTKTPPVPAQYCLETGGRLAADGAVLEPLTEKELQNLCNAITELRPEAVAINLLFSFIDDQFERKIQRVLQALNLPLFICRSSEVLREYKEYERGMATWLNASLGPVVSGYLDRLSKELGDCQLLIMQSSGETVTAKTASRHAVNLLLSGPAAGLAAIHHLSQQVEGSKFLSFDMGGTSTDVALIDGELRITNEGRIADYPVAVPMVDMHTIGAGGGSIAFLDEGGMLQVGPRSAGADPGPACYGRGGTEVTVTDANLILGRLRAEFSLAGSFQLQMEPAQRAISELASASGLTSKEVAQGIIDIANEHMASALRMISVQRGHDPAQFILASFGGAGGLHVCALAELMGMTRAVVPVHAGVLSALGMLVAPRGRQYSRTVNYSADDTDDETLHSAFQLLIEEGLKELQSEGLATQDLQTHLSVDLCYSGQSSILNIPWQDLSSAIADFNKLHQQRYGFNLSREVELVNLRVRITCTESPPDIMKADFSDLCNNSEIPMVYGSNEDTGEEKSGEVNVYRRQQITPRESLIGPAIVTEASATTYIDAGWYGRIDQLGNLWLFRTSTE